MSDDLDGVSALLPGVELGRAERLRGGERSSVWRVLARPHDAEPTSLIVKRFHTAGEGWVRECAALATVPVGAPAPRLITAAPPVLVISDVGSGPSVADALLGDDPETATAAVLAWAEAVGALHAATHDLADTFRGALTERCGDLPVSPHAMPALVDDAVARLHRHCEQLGVPVGRHELAELRDLPRRLRAPEACALSPADTCPDNNVRTGDGLVLVDFEGAEWRHVAWDVAYLAVPWPTCWCAWRLPADLVARALEHYRAVVDSAMPYVRTPAFRADVATAATTWALVSTANFLTNALADDPRPADPAKHTPARRAMILHRLDDARRGEAAPAVADLAARLRAVLLDRWGESHLRLAPAFDTDR